MLSLKQEIKETKHTLAVLKRESRKKCWPWVQWGANKSIIEDKVCKIRMLKSYKTPVVAVNMETGQVSYNRYPSRTTSKHTSQFLRKICGIEKYIDNNYRKINPHLTEVSLDELREQANSIHSALLDDFISKVDSLEDKIKELKNRGSKKYIRTALKALARPQTNLQGQETTPGLNKDARDVVMKHLDILDQQYKYKYPKIK